MFLKTVQGTVQNMCQDAGLLIMRFALGLFFIFHGSQKLFGLFEGLGLVEFTSLIETLQLAYPQYLSVSIAAAEFFGGLLLILGIYTRIAAGVLSVTMFASGYYVYQNVVGLHIERIAYPMNLAYLLVGIGFTLVGLALVGPGRFSLGTLLAMKQAVVPRREPKATFG